MSDSTPKMRQPEWVDAHGRPEIVVNPEIMRRRTTFRVDEPHQHAKPDAKAAKKIRSVVREQAEMIRRNARGQDS